MQQTKQSEGVHIGQLVMLRAGFWICKIVLWYHILRLTTCKMVQKLR